MPEGVEVTILSENLRIILHNTTLTNIKIIGGRYAKKMPTNYVKFKKALPLKIIDVNNRGKFIYIVFENGWSLWNTLGLSGKWGFKKKKHSAIEFKFKKNYSPCKNINLDDDEISPTGKKLISEKDLPYYAPIFELVIPKKVLKSKIFSMYYSDVRRFGTFAFCDKNECLKKKLKSMKYDILNDNITLKEFYSVFKRRNIKNKVITKVLMNPKLFSGIGNYIKAEALYLARISPHREAGDLTKSELRKLLLAIKYVMKLSYKSQYGVYNYLPRIKIGRRQFKFRVYKRKFDSKGNKVKAEKTEDKRTTYWVPTLQF